MRHRNLRTFPTHALPICEDVAPLKTGVCGSHATSDRTKPTGPTRGLVPVDRTRFVPNAGTSPRVGPVGFVLSDRSEEHTSELQPLRQLLFRFPPEKKTSW